MLIGSEFFFKGGFKGLGGVGGGRGGMPRSSRRVIRKKKAWGGGTRKTCPRSSSLFKGHNTQGGDIEFNEVRRAQRASAVPLL